MISNASTNVAMRQTSIHTKREERLGCTTHGAWVGFIKSILDNVNRYVMSRDLQRSR